MRWIVALALVLVLVLVAGCGFRSPPSSGDGGVDAIPAPWWDPAWSARMPILINSAAPLEQGFQIGLPRDLDAAPCDGPRDAVRVVRNHTTELPRVIDELGGDEWIWFQLAAPIPSGAGPSEYWLYCGNPGAQPAPADPADVFDAFDSFEGSSLSSAWVAQGSVSVGGGAVTLDGNNAGIHSTIAYGAGTATDFILQASAAAVGSPVFWGGFEIAFTFTTPWVIWYTQIPSSISQGIRSSTRMVTTNARTLDTGVHLYGVEHYGTSAGFRYGNATVGSLSYNGAISQAMHVRLHNYQSGGPIQFQMARVRKAVDPIPAVTLGEVELRP